MLVMRVFNISDRQALRLSNKANWNNQYAGDLVREYVDKFIEKPEIVESTDPNTLRSYYLTKEQDVRLRELANQFGVSKGLLFRIAIDKGLGIPKQVIV